MTIEKCVTYGLIMGSMSSKLLAVGFGFEYQSTEMSARGNTAVAHTGHAAAAHFNPAALSFLDSSSFELNIFTIHGESEWDNGASTYSSGDDVKFAGSVFYSRPFQWLDRDWAVGFSMSRPYGQSVDWPSDNPARNSGYEAVLDFPQFGVALSHRFNEKWGFGATLNYSRSQLETEGGGGTVLPSDSLSFDGEEDSFSAHFGVLYQPREDLRFGLSCRTGFDVTYEGDFDYESNFPLVPNASSKGKTEFSMPSHIIFGLEYDLNEQWTLAAQSQWTEWSVVDDFSYETNGIEQVIPVNWNDGWIHSVGGTYTCNEKLDLHFGYMYTEPVIDNEDKTLLHSDFEQHFLSCGASYKICKWEAHLAGVYVITKDREISSSNYGVAGEHSGEGFFINVGASRFF